MSVRAGHGIAVIAFSTGHIWMVDVNAGALRVEVAAHSRSIQALHVHPTKPKVLFRATAQVKLFRTRKSVYVCVACRLFTNYCSVLS